MASGVRCAGCGETDPSRFHRRTGSRTGLQSRCAECRAVGRLDEGGRQERLLRAQGYRQCGACGMVLELVVAFRAGRRTCKKCERWLRRSGRRDS